MQVRVMAACMESQADILECTASAQSGRREVTVCFSPMSMVWVYVSQLLNALYHLLTRKKAYSHCLRANSTAIFLSKGTCTLSELIY